MSIEAIAADQAKALDQLREAFGVHLQKEVEQALLEVVGEDHVHARRCLTGGLGAPREVA